MNDASKRERRLAAQKRAAELRVQEQQRARRRRWVIGASAGVAMLAVAGIVTAVIVGGHSPVSAANAVSEPWGAPANVESGAHAAGLQMLSAEGSALHIHQHLTVTVDGAAVSVPADLGIDAAKQQISPIHTHDASGIIHVESPTVTSFALGQVFDEWQQKLGTGQVGTYRDGKDGQTVAVYVNRKPFSGDPRSIPLTDHEDIDIVVAKKGTPVEAPSAFSWPSGY
ncbi:hypothetical protein [Leifsonia sp. LS-T14]|uniref:hypothetical protein n=1 Tax=unclassified Leifsonia TaxID=2663824 RepID=UPI0035A5B092